MPAAPPGPPACCRHGSRLAAAVRRSAFFTRFMSTIHREPSQNGFALTGAIFILVGLAALAVGITVLTRQGETGVARDLLGARAYQAARSGLDWGAYRVLDPLNTTATSGSAALPNCPGAATSTCPTSAAPLSANIPASPFTGTVLAGHTVTLQCWCTDHVEAGRNIRVFQLRSTA